MALQQAQIRNQTGVREWAGWTQLPPFDQGHRQAALGVDRRACARVGNSARVGRRSARGHQGQSATERERRSLLGTLGRRPLLCRVWLPNDRTRDPGFEEWQALLLLPLSDAGAPRVAEALHQRKTPPGGGSGGRRVGYGLRLAQGPRTCAGRT